MPIHSKPSRKRSKFMAVHASPEDEVHSEPTPEHEDYIMHNYGTLGQKTLVTHGNKSAVFENEDEAERWIKSEMKKENFYPSVFYEDDHGGIHVRSLEQ